MKLEYPTLPEANREFVRLCSSLKRDPNSIPKASRTRIVDFNRLIADMKNEETTARWARDSMPAAAPAPAQPPAPARPSRNQCVAILGKVAPLVRPPASWTDDELFLEVERACFQTHLSVPGMRDAQTLSAEYWRQPLEKFTGSARMMRANAKAEISQILTKVK